MSKRRNPFKKSVKNTKYGRYEVSERTGTPRYVTFSAPWGPKTFPVYHVVQSVSVKTSQRPHKLIRGWIEKFRGQWRWRAESIMTVCRSAGYSSYWGAAQMHDRVSAQDRKCFRCFGNVPGAKI